MALPSPAEIDAMMAAEMGGSVSASVPSALPSPAEIDAMMASEQPTWGQSARFVGKSLIEGLGNTVGLAADLNPFDPRNAMRMATNVLGGDGGAAPSETVGQAVRAIAGSPDDEGFVGPTANIVRGGLNALAVPIGGAAGAIINFGSGVAGSGVKEAGGNTVQQLLAALAVPAGAAGVSTLANRAASGVRNIFSPVAKQEAAQTAAKELVEATIDPQKAVASLAAARQADAAVPVIQKAQKSYLPQYQRTAEIVNQPGAAGLEETLRRTDDGFKAAATLQDSLREGGRAALFSKANPNVISQSTAGAAIREGLEANIGVVEEKIGKLAEKAFKGGEELPAAAAKRVITGTLNQLTKDGSRNITSDFRTLVDNFRALPSKVDLQTLQNYRSAFGQYASPGMGASTQEKITAKVANSMRGALDKSIDTAIAKGELPKAQANAWRGMIDTTKQKGATFGMGGVGDALEKNPFGAGFKMAAEDVPKAVISTKEEAQRLVKALQGQNKSLQAVRSAALSSLWDKSTNPLTNVINPATFKKQVKLLGEVSSEILTPSQVKVLNTISDDLASQAKVKGQAFAASRSNSITSEANSAIDILQSAVADSTSSAAREMIKNVPLVGGMLDSLVNIISNPAQRKLLLNKELAKFAQDPKYAEALLLKPTKKTIPILNEFASKFTKGLGGAVQAVAPKPLFSQGGQAPVVAAEPVQAPIGDDIDLAMSQARANVQPQAVATPQPMETEAMPINPIVSEFEGGQQLEAYPPPAKGSGVTVATGIDLGQRSLSELKNLGLSEPLIKKVTPYLGKKDADARTLVKKKPLILTQEEADELDNAVGGQISQEISLKYSDATGQDLAMLPEPARVVVESLAYNFGPNLDKKIPTIWKAIVSGDWATVQDKLRSTKWKQPELALRRNREADILSELV